jgi:hypothetical protein
MYRHGDLILIPREKEPLATAELVKSFVLAEGEETGHRHVLTGDLSVWPIVRNGPTFVAVLEKPAMLTHEEHAPVAVPPGVYEVRRQRVYSPAEVRWVMD